MSTSKHFDKICIALIILALIICVVLMNGTSFGISETDSSADYENTLFDTSKVHEINIEMDDWQSFIASCENEEYTVCDLTIDGETVNNVGIRAKGNTSLSQVKSMDSERYSFKIEFDQYSDGLNYHGLDKLCLNNLIQDNTMMKDYLAYQMMDDFGVESPLSSYAYITVNGEDWGLYLAVESIEESFIDRNYDSSDDNNIYKPDSMSFGGGRGNGKDFSQSEFNEKFNNSDESNSDSNRKEFASPTDRKMPDMANFDPNNMPDMANFDPSNMPNMADFDPSKMAEMASGTDFKMPDFGGKGGGPNMGSDDVKLKYIDDDIDSYANIFDNAKTKASNKDMQDLIASLKNISELENIESSVNVNEVIRYFVVHTFLVNGDSYTGTMVHNYYLHECDGVLSMIPWDYNLAFGTFQGNDASSSVNASIDNPVSGGDTSDRPMFNWLVSDENYLNMYHELYQEFIDRWFANGELSQMIDDTAELIRPYVEKDPTKFCTLDEFEKGVDTIKSFVNLRGQAVQKQLNGDSTTVDASGINTSDMGSMGGGMGKDRGGSDNSDMPSMPEAWNPGAGNATPSDMQNFNPGEKADFKPDGMQAPSGDSKMQPPGGGKMQPNNTP